MQVFNIIFYILKNTSTTDILNCLSDVEKVQSDDSTECLTGIAIHHKEFPILVLNCFQTLRAMNRDGIIFTFDNLAFNRIANKLY